jgi:hypothetical protein
VVGVAFFFDALIPLTVRMRMCRRLNAEQLVQACAALSESQRIAGMGGSTCSQCRALTVFKVHQLIFDGNKLDTSSSCCRCLLLLSVLLTVSWSVICRAVSAF